MIKLWIWRAYNISPGVLWIGILMDAAFLELLKSISIEIHILTII